MKKIFHSGWPTFKLFLLAWDFWPGLEFYLPGVCRFSSLTTKVRDVSIGLKCRHPWLAITLGPAYAVSAVPRLSHFKHDELNHVLTCIPSALWYSAVTQLALPCSFRTRGISSFFLVPSMHNLWTPSNVFSVCLARTWPLFLNKQGSSCCLNTEAHVDHSCLSSPTTISANSRKKTTTHNFKAPSLWF